MADTKKPSSPATQAPAKTTAAGGAGGSSGGNGGLVDRIIQNGKLARDPSQVARARQILAEFVNQVAAAPKGSIGNDVYSFIVSRISNIDRNMSMQMDQIVQNPTFQKFEGSWRGLNKLVMGTETGESLKLRLWVVTKQECSTSIASQS
jgi:type VI secretion system protein ImpC